MYSFQVFRSYAYKHCIVIVKFLRKFATMIDRSDILIPKFANSSLNVKLILFK